MPAEVPFTPARQVALQRVAKALRIYPIPSPEGQRMLQLRRYADGRIVLSNDPEIGDGQARRVIYVHVLIEDIAANFPELA